MSNKLKYWVPIVGVFVTLVHYEKDNGMSVGWCYYQAAVLIVIIWIVSFFSYG
jgi:hypothetical protein